MEMRMLKMVLNAFLDIFYCLQILEFRFLLISSNELKYLFFVRILF